MANIIPPFPKTPHTYDITIKSGADTITFTPADYKIDYTSLAAPNSGRTLNGQMKLEWQAQAIPKVTFTLPAHELHDGFYSAILSLVQGQKYRIDYFDYLTHQKITNKDVYTPETSVHYSYKTTATDITIEAIAIYPIWYANDAQHYIPGYYTINASASPSSYGRVSPVQATVVSGQSCTFQATANAGYEFSHWEDNSVTNPRTITPTGNVSITAYFNTVAPTTYTISTGVTPNGSGTVSGGGTYESGASVTLTATPLTGYTFSQWNDGSTANPRTITVTGNATYTATFVGSAPSEYWEIVWDDSLTFAEEEPEQGDPWDVLGTTLPVSFNSNGNTFNGMGPDEPGELFYYGGTGVWEGSGYARQWNYVNQAYKTIIMYTDPATVFTGDWARFLAANGTVTHHS